MLVLNVIIKYNDKVAGISNQPKSGNYVEAIRERSHSDVDTQRYLVVNIETSLPKGQTKFIWQFNNAHPVLPELETGM